MKRKLLWRFRKKSEADPIRILECGCKQYTPTGEIIPCAGCEKHRPEVKL